MVKDQIGLYYAGLQKVADIHTKKLDLKFKLDFSAYPGRLRAGCYSKLDGEGKVWPETMITTLEICFNLLQGRNIGLWGLVQSAKTHSQILGCIITCIVKHLTTGVYYHPWFFTPNTKKNIYEQFNLKKNEMLECFGETLVSVNKKRIISINDYLKDARDRRNEYIGCAVDAQIELSKSAALSNALCEQKAALEKMLVLSHPTSIRYFNLLQIATKAIEDNGDRIILDRDEAHCAISDGSVNDQINSGLRITAKEKDSKDFTDKMEKDKSIYDMVDRGIIQVISTSATNWDATKLFPVPVTMNENYCGLDCGYLDRNKQKQTVAGSRGIKIKTPDIMTFEQLDSVIGKKISHVIPGAYSQQKTFSKKNEKWGNVYSTWDKYKDHAAKCIAAAIVYFLVTNNNKKHRGMLVRFLNNNELMDQFLAKIEPHLKKHNIKVVKNYDCNYPTVGQLLKAKGVGDDDLYVIFPTGGSRMSDSYPAHCGYGLNFTHESSTLTAILQDILGRLSGYFKNPTIVVSQDAYDYIQEYIELGFFPPTKKRISRTAKRGANAKFVNVTMFEQRLKKWLNKQPLIVKNGKQTIMLGNRAKGNFVQEVIQMSFAELGERLGVTLLPEHEYKKTKENFVQTSFRQWTEDYKNYKGGVNISAIVIRGELVRKQWTKVSFDVITNGTSNNNIILLPSVTEKMPHKGLSA
jgi:hypothetical protein